MFKEYFGVNYEHDDDLADKVKALIMAEDLDDAEIDTLTKCYKQGLMNSGDTPSKSARGSLCEKGILTQVSTAKESYLFAVTYPLGYGIVQALKRVENNSIDASLDVFDINEYLVKIGHTNNLLYDLSNEFVLDRLDSVIDLGRQYESLTESMGKMIYTIGKPKYEFYTRFMIMAHCTFIRNWSKLMNQLILNHNEKVHKYLVAGNARYYSLFSSFRNRFDEIAVRYGKNKTLLAMAKDAADLFHNAAQTTYDQLDSIVPHKTKGYRELKEQFDELDSRVQEYFRGL